MNPETKRFEPETNMTPEGWERVRVGQEVMVGAILCRVRKVTRKDIIVRPMKEQKG